MKKGIIIATALVGIAGGVAIGQTSLFGSAENEEFLTAAEAKKIALQQFNGTVIEYDFDRDDRIPHYEFEIKNDTEEVEVEVHAINGDAKITERKSLKTQSAKETAEDAEEDRVDHVEAEAEIAKDTVKQEQASKVAAATGSQTATNNVANANTSDPQPAAPSTNTNQVVEQPKPAQPVKQAPAKPAIISKSQAIAIAQAKAPGTVTEVELDKDDGIQVYEIEIKNSNTEYEFEIHAVTGQILEFEVDRDDDDDDDRYDD